MNRLEICPSILSADFLNLHKDLKELDKAGAKILHFDVMDGHFVPNISFGPGILKSIARNFNFFLDVHLMVERPILFIEEFFKSGASSLTFHIEAKDDILECINRIKKFNLKCGIAINPKTSLEEVISFINLVDILLIMTVNPGFSGQSFMEDVLEKVEKIRVLNSSLKIMVDGGINDKNISKALKAGAHWFVAGSSIFNSDDVLKSFKNLKEALLV